MMKRSYDYSPKTKPFPHQEEAIMFIDEHKNVAVFDEQGLGKTKIIIDSLSNEIEKNSIKSALIICKKSLMNNWKEEIEFHSHLTSVIIQESKIRRGNLFTFPVHFMIISYETALNEMRAIKQLLSIKNMAVVLDESHKIKNLQSKITQAMHEIAPFAKQRIILSGTPVANKPEDLWAQFYFLDQGDLLGENFLDFKMKYKFNHNEDINSNQASLFKQLKNEIEKKSIRRLKKDVLELPDKIYKNILVPLSEQQQNIYDELNEELLVEITGMNDQQIIDDTENILKKLLRLTQVASNPKLINQKYIEEPAKYTILDKEINNIIESNEKVIIWTSFVGNIIILKKRYERYGAETIYGKMTTDERNIAIKKFKQDDNCKILIANPAAAREGLTLTIANNAIYLDRNFNLVDYLQSQDRIHRISQNKKCNILLLLGKNTVDEYINEILFKKQNVAGFIQGDVKTMDACNLTKNEIVNILER
ncbi:DEAD/DEAH box helicase [Methanococcoides sp. SA1]|nr:DEAD/DEAH box helicase [Methanococcoides sp. SA1]